jgi:hypothetical protein
LCLAYLTQDDDLHFRQFSWVCRLPLLNLDLHSFGYMPKSDMVGHKVGPFLVFLRNLLTDFHSDCSSLHSHQQCMNASFPRHPHQHLLLFSWWLPIWLE